MSRFTHGLTLGKFLPPHLGHLHLIEVAASRCEALTVLVVAADDEALPLDVRVRALRTAIAGRGLSGVRVVGTIENAPADFASDERWQAHIAVDLAALASAEGRSTRPGDPDLFAGPVDAVFTSEGYGEELARRLGATNVVVDSDRLVVPTRARNIRAALGAAMGRPGSQVEDDRREAWRQLPTSTRAALTRRIALVGAESTGKTTLASALAAHYATVWVPEYGRFYTERRGADEHARGVVEQPWRAGEFELIARQQQADEDGLAADAGPVLICDTDALATTIWQRRYTGQTSWRVEAAAAARTYTAYLVPSPEGVPWEPDGIRDGEGERVAMHRQFCETLRARTALTGEPWTVLTGTAVDRLAQAVEFLAPLLPHIGWEASAPSATMGA